MAVCPEIDPASPLQFVTDAAAGSCDADTTREVIEAAARIVALVLIADGHVCRSGFDALNQLDGPRELGLEGDGSARIV